MSDDTSSTRQSPMTSEEKIPHEKITAETPACIERGAQHRGEGPSLPIVDRGGLFAGTAPGAPQPPTPSTTHRSFRLHVIRVSTRASCPTAPTACPTTRGTATAGAGRCPAPAPALGPARREGANAGTAGRDLRWPPTTAGEGRTPRCVRDATRSARGVGICRLESAASRDPSRMRASSLRSRRFSGAERGTTIKLRQSSRGSLCYCINCAGFIFQGGRDNPRRTQLGTCGASRVLTRISPSPRRSHRREAIRRMST